MAKSKAGDEFWNIVDDELEKIQRRGVQAGKVLWKRRQAADIQRAEEMLGQCYRLTLEDHCDRGLRRYTQYAVVSGHDESMLVMTVFYRSLDGAFHLDTERGYPNSLKSFGWKRITPRACCKAWSKLYVKIADLMDELL